MSGHSGKRIIQLKRMPCPAMSGHSGQRGGEGGSVLEPFHFGPALASASQDGGSVSGSGSSPVVHDLFLEKKFLQISLLNLPGLVLLKERYECFALLFQYFI